MNLDELIHDDARIPVNVSAIRGTLCCSGADFKHAIRAEIDERIRVALSEFVEGMKECKNPWHEWMTAKHVQPCPDCGETD